MFILFLKFSHLRWYIDEHYILQVLINGLGRLCCFCPEADKLDYQLLNLERSLEESTSDEDGSTSVPNDTEPLAQNDTEAAKQAANVSQGIFIW